MLWYVLERTPVGRRVYATGGNVDAMGGSSEAAALAGVRISRVILAALVTSGVVAGLAGLLLTSQLSTGDPTVGPGYLLPVIAAVFLGSTQFRGGRFNIWGTVVAAYVLAVGVKGLQLAGLPIWIPDLFNGAALLLAVGLAAWRRPPMTRREAILRLIRNNTTTAWARKRARRTELIARVATAARVLASRALPPQTLSRRPASPLAARAARRRLHPEAWPARLRRAVAFRNMSALYLLALMFVVFALWIPDTFLTAGTWRSLLSDQAVTCLVAVGLVVPTACRGDRPGDRGRGWAGGDPGRPAAGRQRADRGRGGAVAAGRSGGGGLLVADDHPRPDPVVHRHAGRQLAAGRGDRLDLRQRADHQPARRLRHARQRAAVRHHLPGVHHARRGAAALVRAGAHPGRPRASTPPAATLKPPPWSASGRPGSSCSRWSPPVWWPGWAGCC